MAIERSQSDELEYLALRIETVFWQAAQIATFLAALVLNTELLMQRLGGSESARLGIMIVCNATAWMHVLISTGMHRLAAYIRDVLFGGGGWESSIQRNNKPVQVRIGAGGALAMFFSTVLPFLLASYGFPRWWQVPFSVSLGAGLVLAVTSVPAARAKR